MSDIDTEALSNEAAGDVLSRVPSIPVELEGSYRDAIKLGWLLGYQVGVKHAADSMAEVMARVR